MAAGPKDTRHTPQPITAEETDLNAASTRALDARERNKAYREALPTKAPVAGPIPYASVADEETMTDPDSDDECPVVSVGTGSARIQLHTRGAVKVTVDGKRVPAGRVLVMGLNPNGTHAVAVKGADGRVRALEVRMKGREQVDVRVD
jgi:hypothetical protein